MGKQDDKQDKKDKLDDPEEMKRYLRCLQRSISGKPTARDTEVEWELEELRKKMKRDSDDD